MNIIATDSHFRPLSPEHQRAFTSGPAAGKGAFEWRFHLPGTYHYGCCTSRDDRYALTHRGKIFVQSDWERFLHNLIHKEREIVAIFLGLWIIFAISFEAFRLLILVPTYKEAARQLPPLTAIVVSRLLPAAISWVITPASLSLVLLLVSPAAWVVRSSRKHRLSAFGRGYIRRVHWQMRAVMAVCVSALMLLILLGWLSIITSCEHIGETASGLSKAVVSNVDYFQSMITEGNLLLETFEQESALSDSVLYLLLQRGIDSSQVLSDGSVLIDGIQLLVTEAMDLCLLFQQAFLAVNFLFLQLASVTAALGVSAAMRSSASQARAMGWLATFTLTIFFLLVSINGAATVVLEGLPFHFRQEANSTKNASSNAMRSDYENQIVPMVLQLYDYCGGGAWTNEARPTVKGALKGEHVEVVFNMGGVLAREVNTLLGKQVVVVEESTEERGNITFERVHILLESIAWELRQFQNHANLSEIISLSQQHRVPLLAGTDATEEEGVMSVLHLTLSMLQKLLTFLQCKTVGPHVTDTVERYRRLVSMMWELLSLNLAFSVLLAVLIALSSVCAHVIDRPYKCYYYIHSGRWFRFLPSYRAHKTCWKRLHDAIEATQRRLEASETSSERKAASKAARQLQQHAKRNLFYHPPGLSWGKVLQAVSQMYSTLLLWLLLFSAMVISLSIFGHDSPKLGIVESAVLVGLISPLFGCLAIELSQILKQTARLRRIQAVFGFLTALGSCATSVLLLLSLMEFHAQLQSTMHLCEDGRQSLLHALGSNFSNENVLSNEARRQVESSDGWVKKSYQTLAPRRVAAALMRDCGKNELPTLLFWMAVCALGACMGACTCVSGLVFYFVAPRESGGSYGREALLLLPHVEMSGDALAGDVDSEEGSDRQSEGREILSMRGNGPAGDTVEYSKGDPETQEVNVMGLSERKICCFDAAAVEQEPVMLPDDAYLQAKEEDDHQQEVRREDGTSSMTEEKVDSCYWRKTDLDGQRLRRRRMCTGVFVLLMVCLFCVLALRLAWRREDGQGGSMAAMRRCNGAEYLCRISYDKVCGSLSTTSAMD